MPRGRLRLDYDGFCTASVSAAATAFFWAWPSGHDISSPARSLCLARGTGVATSAGTVFLAHLPAGYLLTRRIARRSSPKPLGLGLVASVLPDLDLARFYLLDKRRVPHHAYWTHQPFGWALLAIVWFGVAWLRGSLGWRLAGAVFFVNIFAHLVLDTVAGGIRWLAPFSDRAFVLVSVPASHAWWVSNFVLHWTFLIELGIVAGAARELRTSASSTFTARRPSPAGRPGPRGRR